MNRDRARAARMVVVNDNKTLFANVRKEFPELTRFSKLYSTSVASAPRVPERKADDGIDTVVEVLPTDSISCAHQHVKDGLKPLVLNFASQRQAGGGWRQGCMSQEESLFHATTYALSLDPAYNPQARFYPLADNAAVYSPNVLAIRDSSDYTLLQIKQRYPLDFVACPALRRPPLINGDELTPRDLQTTLNKIRLVFDIALAHEHDSLVLGAWGSGAFKNPPAAIAAAFHTVLQETKYARRFKRVSFPVLVGLSKEIENLEAYQRVFENRRNSVLKS